MALVASPSLRIARRPAELLLIAGLSLEQLAEILSKDLVSVLPVSSMLIAELERFAARMESVSLALQEHF